MRWRAAILGLLLVAVGAARAQDPCECVTCTSKEVPAAVQRGDVAWLRELANGVTPDPWEVACELVATGERAAALEFARYAERNSVKKLHAYLLEDRKGDSDPDFRKMLQAQRKARKANSWSGCLEAAAGLSGELDCLVKIVIEFRRGEALLNLGRNAEGLEPFGRVADAAVAIEWPAMAGKAIWNSGVCHRRAGDLSRALIWFKRALALAEEMGEIFKPLWEMLQSIGNTHRDNGESLEALPYLERALEDRKKAGDKARALSIAATCSRLYWGVGREAWKSRDYRRALDPMARSLALAEETGKYARPRWEMLFWLGKLYRILGSSPQARKCLTEALEDRELAGDQTRVAEIAGEIAKLPEKEAAGATGDPQGAASADEGPLSDLPKGFPFPRGRSRQKYAHIEYSIHLPSDYDPKKKYSLLVAVVGAEKDGPFLPLVKAGFVVCAIDGGETITGPATENYSGNRLYAREGAPWSPANLNAGVEFACFLRRTLAIPPDRAHIFLREVSTYCAGRLASTEGLSASTLCFEDVYNFDSRNTLKENLQIARHQMLSACLRKWRVRAVLFTEDFAADWQIADSILGQLREKRISIEVLDRLQLAAWDPPFDQYAYYFYWLKVQEGRFTPGYDLSFSWQEDSASVMAKMAAERRPGFAYFFSEEDAESKHAKRLQNVVFFDREIRSLGRQLFALKLRKGDHEELFASFGLKSTPAVVTLDPDSVPVTTLERARLTTRYMLKALKDLAEIPRGDAAGATGDPQGANSGDEGGASSEKEEGPLSNLPNREGRLRAAVLDHRDGWSNAQGARKLLNKAGFEVVKLPLDRSPRSLDVNLVVIASFASEIRGYRSYMDRCAREISAWTDQGGVIVQFTQADQTEKHIPFLPLGLSAERCDRDSCALIVLAPRHPLLAGLPISEGRHARLKLGRHEVINQPPSWETLVNQRGFRILVTTDPACRYPVLMEAEAGKGRVILTSLYLDKVVDSAGRMLAAPAWVEAGHRFFENLAVYVRAVRDGQAPTVHPTPESSGPKVLEFTDIPYFLELPRDYDPERKYSLLFAATESGDLNRLKPLVGDGFVICAIDGGNIDTGARTGRGGAPKDPAFLNAVADLGLHLKRSISLHPDRVHVLARGITAFAAARLASINALDARTLCFEDVTDASRVSPYTLRGGLRTHRDILTTNRTRKRHLHSILYSMDLGVDWSMANEILGHLRQRGLSIEVQDRRQFANSVPPFDPLGYYFYWLKVHEGRFTPGYDLSFSWQEDSASAKAKMAAERRPGFAYFFSDEDTKSEHAKRLQNEVFFNREIRSLGRQLIALKLRKEDHEALFASLGLKKTPAVATVDPDFVPVTTLERARLTTRNMKEALKDLAKAVKPSK